MPRPDAQHPPSAALSSVALPARFSIAICASLSTSLDPLNPYNNEYRTVVASLLIVAISYYLAAKPSLSLRFSARQKAVLLAYHASVAALLLTPVRRWWMYAAVVPAHLLVHWAYHIG